MEVFQVMHVLTLAGACLGALLMAIVGFVAVKHLLY